MPQIYLRRRNERKVMEILQEVANEFCEYYCKYPHIWDEEKEGCELRDSDICRNQCPLNRLYEVREMKSIDEIKALEQEPCDVPDINVGDMISRQAAIKALDTHKYSGGFCVEHHIDWSINLGMAHIVLNELPSVTPQPKTGHWIFDKILDKHYYCSECKSMGVDYWDYCPYCGAKMEVEE